jgi:hypothetical protein
MEDLSRNMEKVVKAHTPPKPSKSAGSWSVLLLEDHGRMVLLGKLKRLVIPLALVLIIATVSFAWLLIVFKSTREDNRNLSNALDISRQKKEVLYHTKRRSRRKQLLFSLKSFRKQS